MNEKKPAHVVVVEMIKETIEEISKDKGNDVEIFIDMGSLAAELAMLKRMIIPEKHREEVATSLRQIKESCLLENVDKLLSDTIFLDIAAPPAENIEE